MSVGATPTENFGRPGLCACKMRDRIGVAKGNWYSKLSEWLSNCVMMHLELHNEPRQRLYLLKTVVLRATQYGIPYHQSGDSSLTWPRLVPTQHFRKLRLCGDGLLARNRAQPRLHTHTRASYKSSFGAAIMGIELHHHLSQGTVVKPASRKYP